MQYFGGFVFFLNAFLCIAYIPKVKSATAHFKSLKILNLHSKGMYFLISLKMLLLTQVSCCKLLTIYNFARKVLSPMCYPPSTGTQTSVQEMYI